MYSVEIFAHKTAVSITYSFVLLLYNSSCNYNLPPLPKHLILFSRFRVILYRNFAVFKSQLLIFHNHVKPFNTQTFFP
jgi:hypothetical protein